MTKTELKRDFEAELKRLAACFPRFRPESWNSFYDSYFEHLGGFPISAIKAACQTIVHSEARLERKDEFPTAAELFSICREYMRRQAENSRSSYRSTFHPAEHVCHHNVDKMSERYKKQREENKGFSRITDPRGLLAVISKYEAKHCCCPKVSPVCPQCGKVQQPWQNPAKVWLMEKYPEETKNWNSYHMGFLLCGDCSQ